jgi:hypothetical protein
VVALVAAGQHHADVGTVVHDRHRRTTSSHDKTLQNEAARCRDWKEAG